MGTCIWIISMLTQYAELVMVCAGPSGQGGLLLELEGVTLRTPDGASTLVQDLSVQVSLAEQQGYGK